MKTNFGGKRIDTRNSRNYHGESFSFIATRSATLFAQAFKFGFGFYVHEGRLAKGLKMAIPDVKIAAHTCVRRINLFIVSNGWRNFKASWFTCEKSGSEWGRKNLVRLCHKKRFVIYITFTVSTSHQRYYFIRKMTKPSTLQRCAKYFAHMCVKRKQELSIKHFSRFPAQKCIVICGGGLVIFVTFHRSFKWWKLNPSKSSVNVVQRRIS